MTIHRRAKRRALLFLAAATAILWLPVIGVLLGQPPGFVRNLGFVSEPHGTVLAWVLALAVALLYSSFAIRNIPLVRENWHALTAAKLLGVAAAVGAAVVEEAFFRRVVMDRVFGAGGGSVMQILASALIFGLAHGIWGIVTGNLVAGIGATIATGTVGAALAMVYLVGGRSLAPVITSHFIIDAVIQPGIMFAAFSGQMPRPEKGWWRLTSR